MKVKHFFAAILMALLWGSNFPIMKMGLESMPPLVFSALRSAIVLPLLFFVPRPQSWKIIWIMGLFIGTLKLPLMLLGIHWGLAAGLASLLSQTHVFFTLFLGILWLKEWPNLQNWVSVLIAFGGLTLIVLQVDTDMSSTYGLCAILLSAVFWAVTNITTRSTQHLNIIHLTIWMNLIPPLPLLGASWYIYGSETVIGSLMTISPKTAFSLFYAAFLSGIVGYSIWGMLLRKYPPSKVVHFSLLTPLSAMFFGFWMLDEVPTPITFIGAGLVLGGLILNQFNLKKKFLKTQETIEE